MNESKPTTSDSVADESERILREIFGLDPDKATPIELLIRARNKASDLIDLLLWRLKKPDMMGRDLSQDELMALAIALESLSSAVHVKRRNSR